MAFRDFDDIVEMHERRQPVLADMLTDLSAGLLENARLLYVWQVRRAARGITGHIGRYKSSTDISYLFDRHPHIGEVSLSPEEDKGQLLLLTKLVGYMAIHDGFNTFSHPHSIYRRSLMVDGRKVMPIDFGTKIWAEDYASRMTDAMHLGLDHTLAPAQAEVGLGPEHFGSFDNIYRGET